MALCRPIACAASLQLVLAAAAYAQERTLPPPPAGVQTSREYGIDFVTVNPSGQAVTPYTVPSELNPFGDDPRYVNRPIGNVPYAFRMARTELTTGQYVDFLNLAWRMTPQNRFALEPTFWGGRLVSNNPNDMRWEIDPNVPNAADVPVWGLAFVGAAWYCNYLHNGRQSDLSTLTHGAYDTTTFGQNPDGTFTGQLTRSPGARFWVPSIDEWAMAGFYDSNRNGAGQGGWWSHANSSEAFPAYGPPTVTGNTANAAWQTGNFDEFNVPVGSYPAQSPWGLFDVAGGPNELTEGVSPFAGQRYRWAVGSRTAMSVTDARFFDALGAVQFAAPGDPSFGLRIAASVPCPTAIAVFSFVPLFWRKRC
ncbi:MAG: formylglycine-generating enzyme family protein [Phycisphaerales bacterium]|nr:formylglycine-generating enzyme family protein [Phycisphaerales bacterium]